MPGRILDREQNSSFGGPDTAHAAEDDRWGFTRFNLDSAGKATNMQFGDYVSDQTSAVAMDTLSLTETSLQAQNLEMVEQLLGASESGAYASQVVMERWADVGPASAQSSEAVGAAELRSPASQVVMERWADVGPASAQSSEAVGAAELHSPMPWKDAAPHAATAPQVPEPAWRVRPPA